MTSNCRLSAGVGAPVEGGVIAYLAHAGLLCEINGARCSGRRPLCGGGGSLLTLKLRFSLAFFRIVAVIELTFEARVQRISQNQGRPTAKDSHQSKAQRKDRRSVMKLERA